MQVEFNPHKVGAYRLVGYEKRMLRNQDFNDDKKDAGEIGAGHTVTCLYELVPTGQPINVPGVDPLKYQKPATPFPADAAGTRESLTVKLRYKQPDGDTSKLLARSVTDEGKSYNQASEEYRFAAAVASFGMLLRDSVNKGNATFGSVLELAEAARGDDKGGYRGEFVDLVKKAKSLKGQ